MKNKKFLSILIVSSLLFCLCIFQCSEYDEPARITDHTIDLMESPVITSVNPPDSAVAGVRQIIINGENFLFSGGDSVTKVYIGGEQASMRSITENEIVLDRPKVYGDEMFISIMNPKALGVAKRDYKIEIPVAPFSDFQYIASALSSFAVAPNGDLYIAARRSINHVTADGINITQIIYLGSRFGEMTDIKLGPNGYLYIARRDEEIYRLDPTAETPVEELFAEASEDVNYFDFDGNGNLYMGDRDGIWVLHPDKTETFSGYHDGMEINQIRVFDGYVYVAFDKIIYKNAILDNSGSLGTAEVVVDLSDSPTYESGDISSFGIDENGSIILCLNNAPKGGSIFMLEDDGTVTPYYAKKILPAKVDKIIYGRDRNVYLNKGISIPGGTSTADSVRVYKMGMEFNGAPYLGF